MDFARTLVFNTKGFGIEFLDAAQAARYGELTIVPLNYYELVENQKLLAFRHE